MQRSFTFITQQVMRIKVLLQFYYTVFTFFYSFIYINSLLLLLSVMLLFFWLLPFCKCLFCVVFYCILLVIFLKIIFWYMFNIRWQQRRRVSTWLWWWRWHYIFQVMLTFHITVCLRNLIIIITMTICKRMHYTTSLLR